VESHFLEFDVDTIFVTDVVNEAESLVASPLSDSVKTEGWSSTLSLMAVKKLSLCGSENLKISFLENKWFITLLDERACDILLVDGNMRYLEHVGYRSNILFTTTVPF
jgi:hypothetical protein